MAENIKAMETKERQLVFIPYQDTDCFYEDGILTREFAILYLLYKHGYGNVINIKKPRTLLDRKRYSIHEEYYPTGTIEREVKNICDESLTIQYLPVFNIKQITQRRLWWIEGYRKTIELLHGEVYSKNTLVYSDNPYAYKLLRYLNSVGCRIYFDVMDNFAIHPSLNDTEHKAALAGYKDILSFADIVSANSKQTCDYIETHVDRRPILVKNGVFSNNEMENKGEIDCINTIRNRKKHYDKTVGYIGKLGLRLDSDLIDRVTHECSNTLFVFVGGFLRGQVNPKLNDVLKKRDNVLHMDAVPSAYVYAILDEFDILSIPHAVGKAENGGDPLKLYQYLTRHKPVITTPILGVDEFKDQVCITDDPKEWVSFINSNSHDERQSSNVQFEWNDRMNPVIQLIEDTESE